MPNISTYRWLTILIASIAGLVDCGNHVLIGDEPDGGVSANTGGTSGIGGSTSATGGLGNGLGGLGAGTSTTPGMQDAGNCISNCSTPAGTVQTFSSVSEVYSALVGLWQICPGSGNTYPGAPADTIGVEYGQASSQVTSNGSTVGGNMYYLVQGAAGPVRGSGFNYQLTYNVSPEGTNLFQLNMHPMPNAGFGGSFRYSPCPREFQIEGGSANPTSSATLVPF